MRRSRFSMALTIAMVLGLQARSFAVTVNISSPHSGQDFSPGASITCEGGFSWGAGDPGSIDHIALYVMTVDPDPLIGNTVESVWATITSRQVQQNTGVGSYISDNSNPPNAPQSGEFYLTAVPSNAAIGKFWQGPNRTPPYYFSKVTLTV